MGSLRRDGWRWAMAALLVGCAKPHVTEPPAPGAASVVEAEPARRDVQPLAARGEVRIAGRATGPVFQVELARTDAERTQGLMFRQRLDDERGMLFFMPHDEPWQFWMRNTYLHLDMVFIAQDWRVVGVVENVPPLTEDHRGVQTPSRYVLELAAHQARKHGITSGTLLSFQEVPGRRTDDAAR